MKQLFAAWRKRREHNRKMKRLFAMLEDEALSIRHTMIALTEVYADAARMAQENQSKEASK